MQYHNFKRAIGWFLLRSNLNCVVNKIFVVWAYVWHSVDAHAQLGAPTLVVGATRAHLDTTDEKITARIISFVNLCTVYLFTFIILQQ
jgi:hypothetical protein